MDRGEIVKSMARMNYFAHMLNNYQILKGLALLPIILLSGTISSIEGATMRVTVKKYGATGNGVIDDTAAIQAAIDNSPLGGTVEFGRGLTYRITAPLTLRRARSYIGASTIRMDPAAESGTPIGVLPYGQAAHVRIEGLTFDASGVGGILLISIGGGDKALATDLIIRKNVFLHSNAAAAHDAQSALYNPVGMRNSEISKNRFVDVGKAIAVFNLTNTVIDGNQFDGVHAGNAISIGYSKGTAERAPTTISNNTGKNLGRMAIELYYQSGDPPRNIRIEGNHFSDWDPATVKRKQAFGFSITGGSGHRIINNELNGSGPYGIEIRAGETVIEGNTISGFDAGIVLQQASGSTISNNRLLNSQVDGISLTNGGTHESIKIRDNYIENPRRAGVSGMPAGYGGLEFENNTVVRAGGLYPEDNSTTFYGFQVHPACARPSVWKNNTVIQMAKLPPEGFRFFGFGVFGKCSGNEYSGNLIESRSSTPMGSAFLIYGPGVLDGDKIQSNRFVALGSVLDGFPAAATVAQDNVSCMTRDVNLESVNLKADACRQMARGLGKR
jgi:parallel beta-helix repeat protein